MSKESYIRGFCKAAEAHGVDPQSLAKYAAEKQAQQPLGSGKLGPTKENAADYKLLNKMEDSPFRYATAYFDALAKAQGLNSTPYKLPQTINRDMALENMSRDVLDSFSAKLKGLPPPADKGEWYKGYPGRAWEIFKKTLGKK